MATTEKKEKVKLYNNLGVLLQLEIGGNRYLFDKSPLPSSVKNLKTDRSCKVVVVREGGKVVGIMNGGRIIRTRV